MFVSAYVFVCIGMCVSVLRVCFYVSVCAVDKHGVLIVCACSLQVWAPLI